MNWSRPVLNSRLLAWLAGGGLLITLCFGILLPVYTDEFGWRFQERAGFDGVDILFNDICGPNTIARPPWMMMPARAFSAWANASLASPLFIRLEGVACAMALVALMVVLVRKIEPDRGRRAMLTALACSLLGLGTLPLVLVISRPEQPVMLATLLTMLVTFSGDPARIGARGATLKIIAILLLSLAAQSYHLKGVLYVGVPLVGIAFSAHGRRTLLPRLIGVAILALQTAISARYWVGRLACPDNEVLGARYAHENVVAALASHQTVADLLGILVSGLNPFNYVGLAIPVSTPMSAWLPFGTFSTATSLIFGIVLFVMWAIVIALTIAAMVRFAWSARRAALGEPRLWLALALLGSTEAWNLSQVNRNVYEAAHIIPALVLAMLCALTLPIGADGKRTNLKLPLIGTGVALALFSEIFVMATTFPVLWPAFGQGGYPPGQPFSIALGNYQTTRTEIAQAMRTAHFPQGRRLHRLLVDELTYMALQDTDRPLFRLGVIAVWNGDIVDPEAYLRSRHSDGVVMACRNLPSAMQRKAARVGSICALSKEQLLPQH